MSILIKDMKMPERCLECPFYDNYNYYCILYSFGIPARYNRDGSTRPEWCEIKELTECEDVVSRQAAIDILDDFEVKIENGEEFAYSWARMRLTELPSAQPERKANRQFEKLIAREINGKPYYEIKYIENGEHIIGYGSYLLGFVSEWLKKDFINAQLERKRGTWERTYLDHEATGERSSIFYCSVCSQCIAYPVNFCPSCGADMRGEEHD